MGTSETAALTNAGSLQGRDAILQGKQLQAVRRGAQSTKIFILSCVRHGPVACLTIFDAATCLLFWLVSCPTDVRERAA
jgi:hypothetical protein